MMSLCKPPCLLSLATLRLWWTESPCCVLHQYLGIHLISIVRVPCSELYMSQPPYHQMDIFHYRVRRAANWFASHIHYPPSIFKHIYPVDQIFNNCHPRKSFNLSVACRVYCRRSIETNPSCLDPWGSPVIAQYILCTWIMFAPVIEWHVAV